MPSWDDLLARYDRIAICGGPVTGKSILTDATTDRPVIHSDDMLGMTWSSHSQAVRDKAAQHERFVVAGVAADRAIRKGLEVDCIVHAVRSHADVYTKGQKVLKKQVDKRTRQVSRERDIPLHVFEGRQPYRGDAVTVKEEVWTKEEIESAKKEAREIGKLIGWGQWDDAKQDA